MYNFYTFDMTIDVPYLLPLKDKFHRSSLKRHQEYYN